MHEPTRPSTAALLAVCALGAASLLSACGRDDPSPVSPNPGSATPAPPTDPNDPLQRRRDPNSVPPAMQPAPPSATPQPNAPPATPPSPAGSGGQQ